MLLRIYERQTKTLGRKPNRDEFYPVQVDLAVELLGWELRSLSDLRELSEPIAGRADFQKKIVYVDKVDSEGRWNFTVAHEIGHIVLKHSCDVAFRADDEVRSTIRPETLGVRSRSSAANEK